METAPVAGVSVIPVAQTPDWATVALEPAPKILAGEPLTLSLMATLAITVEGVPDTPVPLSVTGTILALTVMVAVAVRQLAGELLSQS